MVTVAVPQNAMYVSAKWWDCITDISTELAPVALTAQEFFAPGTAPSFVFTREELPITETGAGCFHNYPFARLTGTFYTSPRVEAS
jgi:hypothetical protein